MKQYRWTDPARPNEDCCLELSGSRKPLDSLESSGVPEDGGGRYSFPVEDKARQEEDGEF
jgi:hypothetical protein